MSNQEDEVDLTEYNGAPLLATAAVFLALSWISVILRTYTRAILMKSFQLDDWFMLASQVCHAGYVQCCRDRLTDSSSQLVFTASCAFILRGVMAGMGWHNKAIENKDMEVEALMVKSRPLTPTHHQMTNHRQ